MPSLSPSSRRSFWRRSALRPRASARSVSVAFAICVDVTALRAGAMHASGLHAMHTGYLRPASGQPGLRHFICAAGRMEVIRGQQGHDTLCRGWSPLQPPWCGRERERERQALHLFQPSQG